MNAVAHMYAAFRSMDSPDGESLTLGKLNGAHLSFVSGVKTSPGNLFSLVSNVGSAAEKYPLLPLSSKLSLLRAS